MVAILSFRYIYVNKQDMWELLYGAILLIGFVAADDPTSKQLNVTKEESNLSKRYIISIPQYNSLLYTNSQVLPTQQVVFGNNQALIDYINSIRLRTAQYGIPSYYILPQNNFIQSYIQPNVVPQLQNIVPAVLQRVEQQQIPQQKVIPQVVPQQVLRQQVIPQQLVPQRQQIAPQILRQQIVPQQIVTPQVLRQQVVPQQIIPRVVPQQVLHQQVVPQQVLRQQIVPQQALRQQIVPQQILRQQIVPQVIHQPIVQQRVLPQPRVLQHAVPQQIQNSIPGISFQPIQNNIQVPQVQQRLAPLPLKVLPRVQYQYYQNLPPRTQAVVGNEPFPYEVPPGHTKIPATKQLPVYLKVPQTVNPVPRTQPTIYNPTVPYNPVSYLQGQVNSQPHTVYGNPYQQTFSSGQQVVRIGYSQPQLNEGEVLDGNQVQDNQPRVIYADPSLYSSENNQAVVRIGYSPVHLDQQQQSEGPQQIKLDLPLAYDEGQASGYRYGENNRLTRAPSGTSEDKIEKKEADRKT